MEHALKPFDFTNKIVVITGAGSGIGRALSIQLYKMGARLAVCDLNNNSLNETITCIDPSLCYSETVDVSNKDQLTNFIQNVEKHYNGFDVLINNAGVSMGEMRMQDIDHNDFEKMMSINFWSIVNSCQSALPILLSRQSAALVNISSCFGLMGSKYTSAYCASKFAIDGLTQSLIAENADSTLSIHCVYPGGIKTNMTANAIKSELRSDNFQKQLKTTPEEAAEIIIKGIIKRKNRIIVGAGAMQIDFFRRLSPTLAIKIINEYFIKKQLKKNNN